MTKNTAILLLSHVYDQSIEELHEELLCSCKEDFNVNFLADNTRGIFNSFGKDSRFSLFTLSELQQLSYPGKDQLAYPVAPANRRPYHQHRNFRMGNTELPVMLFFNRFADFDYYWVIEYDVRFSGNWSTLFQHFSACKSDLLGTSLIRQEQVPHWARWSSLRLPEGYQPGSQGVKGFFPIYRISNRALALLDIAYRDGAAGHYECLMPSLLHQRSMSLEDIGGDGIFTQSANINRFYQNMPACDTLEPGTFIFRPIMKKPGNKPDTLWHPVKKDLERD